MSTCPQVSDESKKKCTVCENYIRRIEEVEQNLSGREAIITVLQTQLKKCENNYKKLFDDFEHLRFDHCSALQDNFSLKQINAKLEEFTCDQKKCCPCNESRQNVLPCNNTPDNQRLKESTKNPIHSLKQEVDDIEKLLKSQNQILKDLIEKVINEIKADKSGLIPDIIKIQNDFKQIESGDHLNTHPTFKKLSEEIEKLKSLVEELQKENERMKQFLFEKKSRLIKCTNTSVNIDSVTQGEGFKNKDKAIISTTMADQQNCLDTIAQLQRELQVQETHFERCSCQLIEQLNDMHNNNQILSDTLAVVTAENKDNLEIIANLKDQLNRANHECENKTAKMKNRITQLENDLEENNTTEKKLRESMNVAENQTDNLKDQLKQVIDEVSKVKQCQCDAEKEYKIRLVELETENAYLRKELTEKALELAEYEEENRHFCQKMEVLQNFNDELIQKIKQLEEDLLEISKGPEKSEMGTEMSSTEVEQLQDEVAQLNDEKKCLAKQCKVSQIEMAEKLYQLDSLKNSIKMQLEELTKLGIENEDLRNEIDRLKEENRTETERLQELVNHSQKQVEMLLKEHDEKTSQIENVANELDSIRKSVTEDNENFLGRIRQLENERDDLKRQLEKLQDCNCDEGKEEIERLKAELIKKQCIIMELEKSVDNFNDTLQTFDKTAEELACENACLKNDRDKRIKDLESLQLLMAEKIKELERLRQQLESAEKICEKCSKASKNLEVENKQLKNQCQACTNKTRNVELENELLKNELEKLKSERGQIEKTMVDNYQLQMELDSLKESHSRRESIVSDKLSDLQDAYDELKNLFDKLNEENDKLRDEHKNCVKQTEEKRKACDCLATENEKLRKGTSMMTGKLDTLKGQCDKLRNDCAKKCVEIECLKDNVNEQKSQCQQLREKLKRNEKELAEQRDKLDELRKNYEQKSQDLKKIKKLWETCSKQCQITRDEYNNLRKEYKEIKLMLSDQIKRYRTDTGSMEASQPCEVVKQLKQQLIEKENQMVVLQQKLKDSSYEIIELKDYVHKLIGDNNILKSGINNLIGNLERKIKGPSLGSLPSSSAEQIAGEILTSLTTIEDVILKNGNECPKGCHGKNCDCMLEITSQYNFKDPQQGPSNPKPDTENPRKKRRNACDPCIAFEPLAKSASEPLCKAVSETNTTDSDDPSSASFLDKKSLEFFKDAISDLKTRIDGTMKEKSCDCEQHLVKNRNSK